jgi:holo-[acyl-carrier protein] synthase
LRWSCGVDDVTVGDEQCASTSHGLFPDERVPNGESIVVLVGIDIQPVDEVRSSLESFGERYTSKLFTTQEVASCGVDPGRASRGLAARFAAKEAVMKVLAPSGSVPPWKDIEVRTATDGQPTITLHNLAAALANERGITQVAISLSHAGGFAAAAAVASTVMDTGGDR